MAGPDDDSERLRGERREDEEGGAAEERRRRLVGYVSAGVLIAATVVAIVIVVAAGGDSDEVTGADDAFGPHYEGLADRRSRAGVPVMSDPPGEGAEHIHPLLSVYVNGEQVPVPPNIGIDPAQPPDQMAGLHTHDPTGTVHVENAADPTLGQFFEVWGVPFSAKQLGPHESRGAEKVRMWVDGEPSPAFGELELVDGQEIVIAYGAADELPPDVAP